MLIVKGVDVGYKKKCLISDVNFMIKSSEIVLIEGANGSGKSTLLNTLYRLMPFYSLKDTDAGGVFYNNEKINNYPPSKFLRMGYMYMPQKNGLFEDLSVKNNINVSAFHFEDYDNKKKRMREVFENVKYLKNIENRKVRNLSGGEKKLVVLGMVLMNVPKLLLLDEPLAGLSDENALFYMNVLQNLKMNGTAIIIVEHRLKISVKFSDHIYSIESGKLNIVNSKL